MAFIDQARKASLAAEKARLEREWRKLMETINGLVGDMKDVKARLARLEAQSGQTAEAATHHPQSDSGEQ